MIASAQSMKQALVITRQMLDLAKTGEWEQVVDLEGNRQKIIMANLTGDKSIDRAGDIGQIILNILNLDSEIQTLAANTKNALRDELIELSRTKNKAQAYKHPRV